MAMKKPPSMTDLATEAMLGVTQRATLDDHDAPSPTKTVAKKQPAKARPLPSLLVLILAFTAVVVMLVKLLGGEASVAALVTDVASFRRAPWSAQDNAAAAVAVALSLLPLLVLDALVCARLSDPSARWFLLHALGNLVVAVLAAPDFAYLFRNPPAGLSVAHCRTLPPLGCSDWPTCLIIGMHVYHMLAFKLNSGDLFHHLLFVPVIGGIHFVYPWGSSGNILCFFISGLPGGIDYLMLTAVKCGRMAPIVEKRINCSINTWLRGPGIVAFSTVCIMCWAKPYPGTPPEDVMPTVPFLMCGAITFFNANYYAQRVIGDYYIRKAQDHAKRGVDRVELHTS